MTSRTNPHENASQEADRARNYAFLRRATTSSTPPSQSDGLHATNLQEIGVVADVPAPVIPPVHGDMYVPPRDLPVVAAPYYENQYAVLGAQIPDTTTPTIVPGERILSHPLSKANIKFDENGKLHIAGDPELSIRSGGSAVEISFASDGTLNIDGDTEIVLNSGTQGIVEDVQAASTNADGAITQLDVIRDPSIKIPDI